jgi:phosphoribosylformimino-5-aminoimidazole carboxamide ribotide isomerase
MEIIPAIDIIDGKCVRLSQGDYKQKTVYAEDPLEVAKAFEGAGIRRLHLVDLDGAKAHTIQNIAVLERICTHTSLWVDFGGGVQSNGDLQAALNAGAKQITAGSLAIKNPSLVREWFETYGAETIILGTDVMQNELGTWTLRINGWQTDSGMSLSTFLDGFGGKAKYVISTDVSKDGLLQGPSFALYDYLSAHFPQTNVIASGGVASMADLIQLKEAGVYGAIVGKAFYEGRISLAELAAFQS